MYIQQNHISNSDHIPADQKALMDLADNLVSVESYDHAQLCYEKAAVSDPDDPAPYVGMGIIAMHQQQPQEAQLAFRVACRLDSKCSRAYEGLGTIAQQDNDYEQAFEFFLKCLELDTNNLTALLGLFQTSMQMGSFAKIIHYLQVYLKMHPDDTSVMFTLSTLYIKEDKLDKSRQMLVNILSIAPGNRDAQNLLEELEHHETRTMP